MELRERKKNKYNDNVNINTNTPKKEGDNFFINQLNNLLSQIQINKVVKSDIPFFIIQYFSKNNYRPISQSEIIKHISNPKSFPSLTKCANLRDEILSALRNNVIFEKKKLKYELNFEKCVNYLSTYLEKNKNTNSDSIESNISPKIINFPENENDVVYFASSDENQLNMSFILNEENNKDNMDNLDNMDNSFTFGEQSQIKTNSRNEINMEDLENKALQKYIPEFEFVFDENKNFQNLGRIANEFLSLYKRINNNENNNIININILEDSIKKINSIMDELNIKIIPFNKKSSLFNEEKNELFNTNSVIHQQLKLMEIITDNDFLPKELYESERGIYIAYREEFKTLLNQLQSHFKEIKTMEQNINGNISDLKNLLNEISKEYSLQKNDNYCKFNNIIKDINKSSSIPINVNINETVKLFNSYITNFGNTFNKIEEKAKKKNASNKKNIA